MITFEERCQTDPQGVIQDLVKQTTRQGLEIHGLNELITKLAENAEVKVLIESLKSAPKEKKKKGKKDEVGKD
ncbi:MAG: hypothetical protein M0R80_01390 [Proteobacteria bacterium]|jgi:hypothetical protein|nr:hypothetical protein [Pseudomonadota bacterium]